jgi:N-acetylglutamate synthase-like GNAT family acetyltransferase
MNTHFLGIEEVDAYLLDFVRRLSGLAERPVVWCPLGPSGNSLAQRIFEIAADKVAGVRVLPAAYRRDQDQVQFEGDGAAAIRGKNVLILDSSVHSGRTMLRVVNEVCRFEPQGVCTYSLVVKNSASFVPSFWAVLIEDEDRAYFLLDEIPTQRLSEKKPYLHLRKLCEADLARPPIKSSLASIDRVTWNDRYFDMMSSDGTMKTYLLETGSTVMGYLTIEFEGEGTLSVHEVAVDESQAGKSYGAALMRWADSIARHTRCKAVRLWAIENRKEFYENLGFESVSARPIQLSDGEKYTLMQKEILQHL